MIKITDKKLVAKIYKATLLSMEGDEKEVGLFCNVELGSVGITIDGNPFVSIDAPGESMEFGSQAVGVMEDMQQEFRQNIEKFKHLDKISLVAIEPPYLAYKVNMDVQHLLLIDEKLKG